MKLRIVMIMAVAFLSLFFVVSVSAKVCVFERTSGALECEEFGSREEGKSEEQLKQLCADLCKSYVGGCRTTRIDAKCPTRLENPITGSASQIDIPEFIGTVVSRVLGAVGALTLLVFIYGGFEWLTSAGNDEKVRKGSQAMLYAAIGLFIIFAAYGILNLVIQGLKGG